MEETRIPKWTMETQIEGRRARGRPRLRWLDTIRNGIIRRNLDWNTVNEEQWWLDRKRWKGAINIPTWQELDKGD